MIHILVVVVKAALAGWLLFLLACLLGLALAFLAVAALPDEPEKKK
jgi:hypothetical protein